MATRGSGHGFIVGFFCVLKYGDGSWSAEADREPVGKFRRQCDGYLPQPLLEPALNGACVGENPQKEYVTQDRNDVLRRYLDRQIRR